MGGGGLDYLGEEIEKYKAHYEAKSGEMEEDWKALVKLMILVRCGWSVTWK